MPLYQYECATCGHTFEVLAMRPTAEPTEPCPECGSEKVERTIGLPARTATDSDSQANCGVGPPCAAPWCGRKRR